MELRALFGPGARPVPHALIPLTCISLSCLFLHQLTFPVPLIQVEVTYIDVFVRVNLEALPLSHIITPLTLVYTQDIFDGYRLLWFLLRQLVF